MAKTSNSFLLPKPTYTNFLPVFFTPTSDKIFKTSRKLSILPAFVKEMFKMVRCAENCSLFCMKLCEKHLKRQIKRKLEKKFVNNRKNIKESQVHWHFISFSLKLNFFPVFFSSWIYSPREGGRFCQQYLPLNICNLKNHDVKQLSLIKGCATMSYKGIVRV